MIQHRLRSVYAATVCFALTAGCTAQRATVLPASPNESSAVMQARSAQKATLVVRIRVPRRRHAHYISPSTRGATLTFAGAEALSKSIALSAGSNQATFLLKPGRYAVTIATYDQAPVGGAIPSGAKVLSAATNLPLKIVAGKANSAHLVLAGVPASFSIVLPSATIGTAFSSPQAITVVAKDADGNVIVGSYDAAVTLSDGDNSGHTSVTTSGPDHPPTSELLSSSDTAALAYDGSNANVTATIRAVAGGATAASATFTPVPVLTSISVDTGTIGGTVIETATGDFAPAATTLSGTGLVVIPGTLTASGSQITATLLIDPHTASNGQTTVTAVTNAGGTSNGKSITISGNGVDVVTVGTDTKAADSNGVVGNGTGSAGDLRYTILNATAGDTIVFDTVAMCRAANGTGACTITLSGPLPPIVQNQTIDGSYFINGTPRVTIDGASAYRAFWADSGTIALNNLQIRNVSATGGAGGYGPGGGGGGAGLGGGLFDNAATVNVTNDYFLNCAVAGGSGGGTPGSGVGSGGGGGLGGSGSGDLGSGNPQSLPGGGGGGVLGAASAPSIGQAGNGGYGGGGGGGQEDDSGPIFTGGSGGAAYAGNGAGSGYSTVDGGAGGFGGGGGGGGYGDSSPAGAGGLGGVGGGGGGGGYPFTTTGGAGANGGAGGGGGGGKSAGSGGALVTISGGNGAASAGYGSGGGGAAAGPAIFVYGGTLTTTNSGSSNCAMATAGAAGGTGATAGGTNTMPVYNNGGTVNGSATTGGIASALGSTPPSLRRRTHTKINRRS